MNMQEVTKAQIIEAQAWIRDCSWTQFLANCQFNNPSSDI
jgi:hypothetical protein